VRLRVKVLSEYAFSGVPWPTKRAGIREASPLWLVRVAAMIDAAIAAAMAVAVARARGGHPEILWLQESAEPADAGVQMRAGGVRSTTA